jgi:6-phosphogluconolactonase
LLLSNMWQGTGLAQAPSATANDFLVYVGSYTHPTPTTSSASKGIHGFRFDPRTGALTPIGLVAETVNPAHVWPSADGRFLYAVNWQTGDKTNGDTVSAFSIDQTSGQLTFLNKVSSHGESPNQVVLDPTGKAAVTVTYKGGTVTALPVGPDGRLGESFYSDLHLGAPSGDGKQPAPHVHGVVFSKDGRFAFVAELGLDRVYSYTFDGPGRTMKPCDPAYVEVKRGSGPRRLQLHPSGRFLYVNMEATSSASVFEVDSGRLKEIQSLSTLPADYKDPNTTAEIQIDHTGRFLYVSNRGHDSIAVYDVDPNKGTLKLIENAPSLGKTPRNLTIDPTNQYLFVANQAGENVVLFRIDQHTGHLSPANVQASVPQAGGIAVVGRGVKERPSR